MDKRIVEFIRALRATGVRVSLAESQDASYGVDAVGAQDRASFRETLRATLIKDVRARQAFDTFFPLFFNSGQPPLQNVPDELTDEQRDQLRQAMQSLMGQLGALRQLLQQMVQGQAFDRDQLDAMADRAGVPQPGNSDMRQRSSLERRMMQQAQLTPQQVQQLIDQLMEQLEQMGMSADARTEVREMLEANADGLSEQVRQHAGTSLAERLDSTEPDPRPDLQDVPFEALDHHDIAQIREEMRRLAAKLKTRAALRQRRDKHGKPDLRRTMRASLRTGGVPMALHHRTRHKKPALVVICDVSTSMRFCAEFLLTLVYTLQDHVARTHSYVFNADLADVSMIFREKDPMRAVEQALRENPPGYYATDLGNSLQTFANGHMGNIGHRTTVIILGDGRNNYRDPRLDLAADLQRKARRVIWLVPEHTSQWGTGDSDMHEYARLAHGTHHVACLRDLAAAVDAVIAAG